MSPRLILVPLLLAAAGCEFFGGGPGPEDDPATDGVLSCGETMSVDGLSAAENIPIDAPAGVGIEIATDFAVPEHGARLELTDASGTERRLELWDPARGVRVIPALLAAGQEAELDLLGAGEFEGTVTLRCESPGEDCGDVVDNDGDGAVDCADLTCARDPGCAEDQRDFEVLRLACTDGWEPVDIPVLDAFSDQRTIYRTQPGTVNEPWDEFWGGAEVVITTAPVDRFVQVRFGGAGLACGGLDDGDAVGCGEVTRGGAGTEFAVASADLPLWLEPLGASWEGLEVRVDCGSSR